MAIFTFVSDSDAEVVGFTVDRTGANLPAEWAPWHPLGTGTLSASVGATGVGQSEPVQQAIREQGFYVARAKALPQGGSEAGQP
jgi:hypothetical protein